MTAAADRQEGIVGSGLGLLTSKGWVYRNVDLVVPRGALALVTGPSGCGKTALLLAIAARMRPSTGALRLGDCDAVAQPQRARRLVGLGETAGVNDLDPTLTVAAQLKAELAMHRRGRGHGRDEAEAAFADVGLDVDPHTKIADQHAADRLLLGVALAAIDRPPFLVVDDLHEDLTPAERELVFDRLRGLADSGVTIVVGSLDPALAALADVVLTLDGDGQPASGAPAPAVPASRTAHSRSAGSADLAAADLGTASPIPHLKETADALV